MINFMLKIRYSNLPIKLQKIAPTSSYSIIHVGSHFGFHVAAGITTARATGSRHMMSFACLRHFNTGARRYYQRVNSESWTITFTILAGYEQVAVNRVTELLQQLLTVLTCYPI